MTDKTPPAPVDRPNISLILYTADHGELLGNHHAGNKSFFCEGSAHIPLATCLPSRRVHPGHGTVSHARVTHAPILPTVVKAAGGTPNIAAPMRRLKNEMIRRLARRKSQLVRRNRLVGQPVQHSSEADVRNNFVNIGLMTEQARVDTRH